MAVATSAGTSPALEVNPVVAEVCPGSLLSAEDWGLEDPAGKSVEQVREIRDEIRIKVEGLIREFQP